MDIYDILEKDHHDMKELLAELISLDKEDDYRMILVEQIATELVAHSRAEESVFYNTLRAADADKALILHSFKDHMEAEGLLRMLQVKEKADFDWKKTAMKLQDALEEHIRKEEDEVFTLAREVFNREEAISVGEAFTKLKSEISTHGFLQNSMDVVINMMPPRFVNKIRNLQQGG